MDAGGIRDGSLYEQKRSERFSGRVGSMELTGHDVMWEWGQTSQQDSWHSQRFSVDKFRR